MDVKYKGRASHAAGFPWEGVNALDAAVMAYNNVSVLRQQMKPSWRVHGMYDRTLLLRSFMVREFMANPRLLVTVRKRSYGKVVSSQVTVILSRGGGLPM